MKTTLFLKERERCHDQNIWVQFFLVRQLREGNKAKYFCSCTASLEHTLKTNLQILHYQQGPSSTVVHIEVVNKFISNTLYILMEKNFVSSNNNEISFLF